MRSLMIHSGRRLSQGALLLALTGCGDVARSTAVPAEALDPASARPFHGDGSSERGGLVNMGRSEVDVLGDHWTVVTRDRMPSCHVEHTVAVTSNGIEILTADE